MTWSTPTQSQSILNYIDYTATLLANGLIVYIGGRGGSSTSTSPSNIAQDRNIIIYGGATLNNTAVIGVFSDTAILNTNS
ncbi:hypothetical protein C2G38_2178476 [Gigaspora rosea]|uniref:Uncharacterized protein n=1 Tax=Gigaspora rosea TaxID=44941 RepID=A0A397VE75_9GLOM|nr:hypothetical protein C2G38_2178476 [Gigaspora rosea]